MINIYELVSNFIQNFLMVWFISNFCKYKFTGNGYDFENLFRSYVENKLPKLSNELRYDSEAGMFSAFSDSEKPLEKIAYYFNNDLKNNKDFITSLILNMTDYEVQL